MSYSLCIQQSKVNFLILLLNTVIRINKMQVFLYIISLNKKRSKNEVSKLIYVLLNC